MAESSVGSSQPLSIVVAYAGEDVSWTKEHMNIAIIYQKGGDKLPLSSFPHQIPLPNIGRESHTYLYHVVHQYRDLTEVVLFTQGALVDHVGKLPQYMITKMSQTNGDVVILNSTAMGTFRDWAGIKHKRKWADEKASGKMRPASQTPGEFWTWMFGTEPPEEIKVAWGAVFAVKREAIQRHPKEFYEKLLKRFEDMNHPNPEEGHYMERFWLSIFGTDRLAFPFPSRDIPEAEDGGGNYD